MSIARLMQLGASAPTGPEGAWDLSYAYYDPPESLTWSLSNVVNTGNESISAQETRPRGLFFKPDGTKMYIIGWDNDVNEYNLSTPWQVSSASYFQNLNLTGISDPNDFFFKPDGTKMYIVDGSPDDVNEYFLSTAWDISSASFVRNFSAAAQDTNIEGIFFKPDGTKMYLVGQGSDRIYEYNLSTAWIVTTASFVQSFSSINANATGVSFKPDGTKMFVVDEGVGLSTYVTEYALSVAWDISSASYSDAYDTFSQEDEPQAVFFKPDGTAFYIVGLENDRVYQYSLGSVEVNNGEELFFKPDGTKMYVTGNNGDSVNEYDLSTAWDISSLSFLQSFSVSTREASPTGLFFKPDGTNMYIIGQDGDEVNEYALSIAWDISSASYLRVRSVSAQETEPKSLFFKPDGTKMYVVGTVGDDVNEYDLSTAWNVSTASYLQNFSVSVQEGNPNGLFFKPDGTKMYVTGTTKLIYEYDLSSAWDVSSASYLQEFSFKNQAGGNSLGIFFKEDGTQMYLITSGRDVFSYTLGPQD